MVKHTQTIRSLLETNFLSVFDHFVGLALKGLHRDEGCQILLDRTVNIATYPFQDLLNLYYSYKALFCT